LAIIGTKEPMTIIHGRKDKAKQGFDALPKAGRKPRQTAVSQEQRGGKVLAVEKRPIQLELFATTAEARPETAKAKGRGASSKGVPKPKVPKVANTTYLYGSAEMERVCAGLHASLEKVVSNKGTAGPDRQSVKTVKSNWGQIHPKLVQLLLKGEYHPGDIRRVWIPARVDGIFRNMHGWSGTVLKWRGCAYTQKVACDKAKTMEMATDDVKTLGQTGSEEAERREAIVRWPQRHLEVKPYLGGKPNLEQCLLAQGRITILCGTLEEE
jgi:hypothetical protein